MSRESGSLPERLVADEQAEYAKKAEEKAAMNAPKINLRTYPDVQQGTEEWADLRRGMVTASSIGALLSVGKLGAIGYACTKCPAKAKEWCVGLRDGKPLKTLHTERAAVAKENEASAPLVIEVANNETSRSLTKLLVSERITGWTEPTFTSDDMWRGVEDEPRARDLYGKHYAPVTEMGFMVRQEDGWTLGYSPDGLVGEDGLIEVKSRRAKSQLSTVLADDVPAANIPQLQAALFVSGRRWIDYVSFTGGMALFVKRVFPDERWFAAIEEACRTFEHAAESMANTYLERVDGLPVAERIVEMEMSL